LPFAPGLEVYSETPDLVPPKHRKEGQCKGQDSISICLKYFRNAPSATKNVIHEQTKTNSDTACGGLKSGQK